MCIVRHCTACQAPLPDKWTDCVCARCEELNEQIRTEQARRLRQIREQLDLRDLELYGQPHC